MNGAADNVTVLFNSGGGALVLDADYVVGDGPRGAIAADLDADGDLELAVANGGGDASILNNNLGRSACPGPKVLVCHVPPGKPGMEHAICISPSALPAHLAHGDRLGACGPR